MTHCGNIMRASLLRTGCYGTFKQSQFCFYSYQVGVVETLHSNVSTKQTNGDRLESALLAGAE